jgi:ribosome-binding factor A
MPREFPRALRLNAQIQRELVELIREELSDPRIGSITVTSVDVSRDLRDARVSVSLLGDDAQLKEAVVALKGAAGLLRKALAARMSLRTVPALIFKADWDLRQADHVQGLIRNAVAADAHSAAVADSPADAKKQ